MVCPSRTTFSYLPTTPGSTTSPITKRSMRPPTTIPNGMPCPDSGTRAGARTPTSTPSPEFRIPGFTSGCSIPATMHTGRAWAHIAKIMPGSRFRCSQSPAITATAQPDLVQNRVNIEVMGENRWRHVPSLDDLGESQRFYLTATRVTRSSYLLSTTTPKTKNGHAPALHQEVNLADRTRMTNDSYPYLVLGKKLDRSDGYTFVTQPFARAEEVSGLDGIIHLRVNKR